MHYKSVTFRREAFLFGPDVFEDYKSFIVQKYN